MPKIKAHPLYNYKPTNVFAVQFKAGHWGFLRCMMGGSSVGLWEWWSKVPELPPLGTVERPEKWFYTLFASKSDPTEVRLLGSIPFKSEGEAWCPPRYAPPSSVDPRYKIYYRTEINFEATEEEVRGLPLVEIILTGRLVEKFNELFDKGLLRPVPENLSSKHGGLVKEDSENGQAAAIQASAECDPSLEPVSFADIKTEKIRSHHFLTPMSEDDYYPSFLVDKCKAVLLGLCADIEKTKPKTEKDLLKLSHAATALINDLEAEFMENDSELETVARDALAAEFEFIVRTYGFDIDVEEVIANREW